MIPRAGRCVAVASMGFLLQMAVLLALTAGVGMRVALATLIAVSAAVLHNAAWHDRWTWADRPVRGAAARARRLLALAGATGAVSVGGGVLLTPLWVDLLALPVVAANVLSVVALGAVNYAVADRGVMR